MAKAAGVVMAFTLAALCGCAGEGDGATEEPLGPPAIEWTRYESPSGHFAILHPSQWLVEDSPPDVPVRLYPGAASPTGVVSITVLQCESAPADATGRWLADVMQNGESQGVPRDLSRPGWQGISRTWLGRHEHGERTWLGIVAHDQSLHVLLTASDAADRMGEGSTLRDLYERTVASLELRPTDRR